MKLRLTREEWVTTEDCIKIRITPQGTLRNWTLSSALCPSPGNASLKWECRPPLLGRATHWCPFRPHSSTPATRWSVTSCLYRLGFSWLRCQGFRATHSRKFLTMENLEIFSFYVLIFRFHLCQVYRTSMCTFLCLFAFHFFCFCFRIVLSCSFNAIRDLSREFSQITALFGIRFEMSVIMIWLCLSGCV